MKKDLKADIAWASGVIAVSLAATIARQFDYITAETSIRIALGATGLMLAWYGNRMPKAFAPEAKARQVTRVAGWSMAISGLIYAGLWAFAPMTVALVGGCGAIIVGMIVTLLYCRSLRAKAKAA
jgi:hypothetical protein